MQPTNADARQSIDTELCPRDVRALTECHTVLNDTPDVRDADGLYEVVSQSGKSYTVDSYEKSCKCPDACYNDRVCKHIRRVMFSCGMRPIPSWVDVDAVDEKLGEHVTGTPRAGRVATDGGPGLARETTDETDEGPRPDGCECWTDAALPCLTCYLDGFEGPNPDAPADDE